MITFGFPASGYRLNGSGGFNNVSSAGYSWSSSAYGLGSYSTHAAYLNMNSTWDNPLNNGNRTYGFPVRCVQAYTKITNRFICEEKWTHIMIMGGKSMNRECCRLIKNWFAVEWFVNSAICWLCSARFIVQLCIVSFLPCNCAGGECAFSLLQLFYRLL